MPAECDFGRVAGEGSVLTPSPAITNVDPKRGLAKLRGQSEKKRPNICERDAVVYEFLTVYESDRFLRSLVFKLRVMIVLSYIWDTGRTKSAAMTTAICPVWNGHAVSTPRR